MKSEHKARAIHHSRVQMTIREKPLAKGIASIDITTYVGKTGLGAKSTKSASAILRDLDCQN